MQRFRFFMLLLVCTAVVILSAPGAAAAHGSPSGGVSDAGGIAGAASSASSGTSGVSSSVPPADSGPTESSTDEEPAQAAGGDRGAEPGISEDGGAAGEPGSPPAGHEDTDRSPDNGQGQESQQDFGSGYDSAPGPWYTKQVEPSWNPEAGSSQAGQEDQGRSLDNGQGQGSSQNVGSGDDSAQGPRIAGQGEPSGKSEAGIGGGPQSGFMGADAPGETANRVLREGSGFQGGGEFRTHAGIIVFGTAVGMARGSDIRNSPAPGDGGAGRPSREGAPEPPWHPSRDTAPKSVPPETAARIEKGGSESPSRARAKREEESDEVPETCCHVPEAPAPDSVPGLAPFFLFSLFGFRRIQKKNVLDNDCRRAVFHAIGDAPGIDAVSLSERLEMNINTLRYHLAKLLATDKITYLSRPGTVRYYLNQGRYSPFEQLVLHYLRAETAGSIILLVSERPGISRQDLAAVLGISGPSVTRHMQQLSSESIVRNEPDGRANHYYLTEEAALLLKKFQIILTGIPVGVYPAPV
ncbi:MAG: winged helix-turn-helix transcriptional regulator [Methanomicrobiales archaeon]|nr:winged helix-turn-helix transcriptional regulator [Methanomicrobiales archaeon]